MVGALLLVVGEAMWIVAGMANMGEFAALKLSALIGIILPTDWFATLGGVKLGLRMLSVAASWWPGHVLQKQLHHKAAVCPVCESSFSLCLPVLTVIFEYRFPLEALPHDGYLDKVTNIAAFEEERLRPWQPFPAGCTEKPPYTASGWCFPAWAWYL